MSQRAPSAEMPGGESGGAGCLRAALVAPVLLVLAPFAAALRWISRLRRGHETKLHHDLETIENVHGDELLRARIVIDVPSAREISRDLTAHVVRLAEGLADGSETYHLLRDEPGSEEPVVVSFGPTVQILAERFLLTLQRSALENRTVVWVALPRSVHLGTLLDPTSYSPEAEGEPEAFLREAPLLWALVIRRLRSLAAVCYEVELFVPKVASEQLQRFSERVEGLSKEDARTESRAP